ncbi:ABC transporter substrate-binding protein [Paenibacillus alvei]|uniref:Extracellular solute-binding protein n=1 Tax=Paenibacillus alvei TaxID=44250 RepID=A0A383R928_PAEAL|nr:extracellular solute-binding protein [Paenibacillus alvei]SYX83647.1 Extracellular solute-binding protein [Paenibacillus alvei]
MKKRIIIIFTSLLLVTMTVACGSSNEVDKTRKTKEGKTIVTMSLFNPNSWYASAIKKFEQQNPDIEVRFQLFKQENEKWEEQDDDRYVQKINTELLSGAAADIIEVANLPVGKYVNKKLILNMNDFIKKEKLLENGDLYPNIVDEMGIDGGLYSMPLSLHLHTFLGDGNILEKANVQVDDQKWTWQQFEQVAKQIMKSRDEGDSRYALANTPPEEQLLDIVIDQSSEFIDRSNQKANFDSPSFITLMEQIKSMYDHQVATSKEAGYGEQLFSSIKLVNPPDFIFWPHTLYKNPVLLNKPHAAGQTSGVTFSAPKQLAISSKSDVSEEAWKLISFLASEQAQSMPERGGFSVLASVNEQELNYYQKQVDSGEFKLESGQAVKATEGYFIKAKQLLAAASGYRSGDDKLYSIVGEEAKSYFSGQKSAEEVAKLIDNRVNTYLNE